MGDWVELESNPMVVKSSHNNVMPRHAFFAEVMANARVAANLSYFDHQNQLILMLILIYCR